MSAGPRPGPGDVMSRRRRRGLLALDPGQLGGGGHLWLPGSGHGPAHRRDHRGASHRRPGSALAWLLAIMVFPIIGFPLYLLLGKAELPRKRRAKQAVVNRLMRVRAQGIPDSELDEDVPS